MYTKSFLVADWLLCTYSMYTTANQRPELTQSQFCCWLAVVNGQQSVHEGVIYFIHQMAIHNTTKLLPLTNQTKLTLTVALTITDTVTVLF